MNDSFRNSIPASQQAICLKLMHKRVNFLLLILFIRDYYRVKPMTAAYCFCNYVLNDGFLDGNKKQYMKTLNASENPHKTILQLVFLTSYTSEDYCHRYP